VHVPKAKPSDEAQRRLLSMLDGWEALLRARAAEFAGDLDMCRARLRDGAFGSDDHFAEVVGVMSNRAARDAALILEGQVELAMASIDIVNEFITNWRLTRGAG
jgi:hypothetical protein